MLNKQNMYLIKLSETHYIVVDDSEIKPCQPANICMAHKTKVCDKCDRYNGMRVIKEPSIAEVEEAIYGYSVEKMADEYINKNYPDYLNPKEKAAAIEDVIWGFNAHKELVKNKFVFSLEQIHKIIAMSKMAKTSDGLIDMDAWISNGYEGAIPAYSDEEIIQSLLPPTEWKVIFDEQGKLKLI